MNGANMMGWSWVWEGEVFALCAPNREKPAVVVAFNLRIGWLWTSVKKSGRAATLLGGVLAALKTLDLNDDMRDGLFGLAAREVERFDILITKGKHVASRGYQ